MKLFNYFLITFLLLIISCITYIIRTEGLISSINDDFQRPRAYFHPFTTDYESYSRSQLPPSDPRRIKDEKMLISRLLS